MNKEMNREAALPPVQLGRPASLVVELLLSDFDELIEVDLANDRVRSLRHTEEKYFMPRTESSFRKMYRYCAEYIVHPDERERFLDVLDPDRLADRLTDSEDGALRSRFRYKRYSGGWCETEQTVIGGAAYGLPRGVCYAFMRDVSAEGDVKIDAETFQTISPAECNELTGLLWEELFCSLAKELIKNWDENWCMLAVDLEKFKLFNEWYGRDQGDLLLSNVGKTLLSVAQERSGLAGYFGQDDFAMLLPYDKERIAQIYEDVHALIKRYGTSVGFMPAIGVSMVDREEDATVYDYYDRAALASRRAKDDYHERICIFHPSMYRQTDRDYHILSDFQKALRERELFIQLQPQCNVSSGKIVGAESLVRWRKANGELVPPGVFVPVLEKYGFVTDLDQYVWEEICVWQKRWIDGGRAPLPISVNVSLIDIFTIDVPAFFEKLLEKYDLPVHAIEIEIAESAYVDSGAVADTVRRLRARGFAVLMDDFGSGYSSLNVLRSLNVDIIKLDTQFLRMSGEDKKGVHIMESIVNMAKTMGVPIIVEGVETKEETAFLAGLGCRYMQGYHFYRPMAMADFEALAADPKRIDTRGFRFKAKEQFHIREFLDQNLFSDTVLNNILGPVAFYLWHGNSLDITRYNQQFKTETRVSDIERRMQNIQQFIMPEDIPLLFELLRRAMKNPTSGAEGVLRFYRSDNSIAQLRARFFYLEEDKSGKKFYGSIHDLTEFVTLNDHLRLLSQISMDSVVFARRREEGWTFHVVIHGLEHALKISWTQLRDELTDGRFYERFGKRREALYALFARSAKSGKPFSFTEDMLCEDGAILPVCGRADYVHDEASGVEYVLTLRKRADGMPKGLDG